MSKKWKFVFVFCCVSQVQASTEFDVISITNVPFPSSSEPAASISVPYSHEIPEFTICYRFFITFYNDRFLRIFSAKHTSNPLPWDGRYIMEEIRFNTGFEYQGYQILFSYHHRIVPGGGLGGLAYPTYFIGNLPRNIKTGTWNHFCVSYSSKLHRRHNFINGQKVSSFKYLDDVEDPMPASTFENIVIGINMRGIFTDLNIYDKFFTEEDMISWTSSCLKPKGEIFEWDIQRVKPTKNTSLNVTLTRISSSDVCPEPNKKNKMQEPSRLGKNSKKVRYKPTFVERNPSRIGKVVEMISDPYPKTLDDAKDMCYRLAGDLLTVPQTEEEEKLLSRLQVDFMMKKAANNRTYLDTEWKLADVWVGGETRIIDLEKEYPNLENRIKSRDLPYPGNGYLKHYHSSTGAPVQPRIQKSALLPN